MGETVSAEDGGRPRYREAEAWYRKLVEKVPAVVYVDAADAASSSIYVSPPSESLLGYAREEWVADPELWVKVLHPDARERVLTAHARALEEGGIFWEEYRMVHREGRVVWVRDEAAPMEDGDGCPGRRAGILLDITERKKHEEELRESEEMFRAAFEAAGVGMAHVAPDGRWLRVNRKACEIVGYPCEELLRMTFIEMTPPEDREVSAGRVRRLLAGEIGPYSVERRYVRKGGRRVWVNLTGSLVRKESSGEPAYFVCVAEDVTERKLANELLEPLTPRESEVLGRIGAGRKNPEIARDLSLSLGTVKRDVRYILNNLGAGGDRRLAALRAIDIGLVPPQPY